MLSVFRIPERRNILKMGYSKYLLYLWALIIQGLSEQNKANILKNNIIATISKTISKCQLDLPPEERNVTVRIKCIGTETEDGNVEELTKRQLVQRFGQTNAAICGAMTSIECEEVLPTTTTTTTT
ncbi:unnamed protein product, partial [Owenia fusiformis]